jgi:hypothetical protein
MHLLAIFRLAITDVLRLFPFPQLERYGVGYLPSMTQST